MYSQVLLLFVITAAVRVDCEVDGIPFIQWDADCDSYNVTTGVWPRAYEIHYEYSTSTADQCRSLCTGRQDCGGFVSYTKSNNCYLLNINDEIIDQYLSKNWYKSKGMATWHSKTCGYNVGDTDLSCNNYTDKEYQNQYPADKWRITYTYMIPDLNATECHRWCGLYTGCRSVRYDRSRKIEGSGWCHLYETTIQDLEDKGLTVDVAINTDTRYIYTTYDRYCADGTPYKPDQK